MICGACKREVEPEKALRATYFCSASGGSVGGGVYCSSECKVKGILLRHERLDELFEEAAARERVTPPFVR